MRIRYCDCERRFNRRKYIRSVPMATIFPIDPRIILTSYGEWLAVTPDSCGLRIGVIGKSEDEVRQMFNAAQNRAQEILNQDAI